MSNHTIFHKTLPLAMSFSLLFAASGSTSLPVFAEEAIPSDPVMETISADLVLLWEDSDNQDGIRPDSLTATLFMDDAAVETVSLTAETEWFTAFQDYPALKDDRSRHNFSIEADTEAAMDYSFLFTVEETDGISHFYITARHEPQTQELTAKLAWIDEGNKDGSRPDTVTLGLYAEGELLESYRLSESDTFDLPAIQTLSSLPITNRNPTENTGSVSRQSLAEESEIWEADFGSYAVHEAGQPIHYEIKPEDSISGYEYQIALAQSSDGEYPETIITAVHEPEDFHESDKSEDEPDKGPAESQETESVSIQNQDIEDHKEEPSSSTENLSENDEPPIDTAYSESPEEVEQSSAEETINISGRVIWDDSNDTDKKRPSSVIIHLLADGNILKNTSSGAEQGWTYSFTDLPKYTSEGKTILYTVESQTDGYLQTISGYNIINTHTASTLAPAASVSPLPIASVGVSSFQNNETVNITGSITWVDNNNLILRSLLL